MIAIKHILCPVDSSEFSARALRYAAALASWYEAELEALVPDSARAWCDPEVIVGFGKPYREVLRVAAERHADLIVLGMQGRGAIDLALFGSTAQHVVRGARCPVLTVGVGTAGPAKDATSPGVSEVVAGP